MSRYIKPFSSAVLSLTVLTGCGSAEQDAPELGAAMSALGGSVTAPLTIDTAIQTPADTTGAISSPNTGEAEDTKSLVVADDFAFDTAQYISIDFDLEAARGTEGSVSVCTDYILQDTDFDIDYESCTVQGAMTNGQFSHHMEVTNEFDSVVAVIWFQDESIAPVYREFSVNTTSASNRSVKTQSGRKVLVWR